MPDTVLPSSWVVEGGVADDPGRHAGALNGLFALTGRGSERVIHPINDSAVEAGHAGPAFYCVHSLSGAGGTDFRQLARLMPGVRFYGIQAPPKKMRDQGFGGSVEAIAEYYADALVRFQPHGHVLLGGWSAGAIIGLEIAQNLRSRGREVALFAAIDAAPENTAAGRRPWHPIYLLQLAANLPGWVRHENLTDKTAVMSLVRRAGQKTMARVKATFGERNATTANDHAVEGIIDLARFPAEQRSFMKRLYRALLEYHAKPYSGDVVVYEARVKPLLHLPQLGRVWRRIAPRSVIVPVDGTHASIMRKAHVPALADDLRARIARIAAVPVYDVAGRVCSLAEARERRRARALVGS
ncbi:thioesterase domain-containing protein [Rhodopila sp.]|uniref:thioesterase domain-containing protein n=1 Tax=Rhodopila sp. TaxID=2480087 RepID=UPI003D0A24A3